MIFTRARPQFDTKIGKTWLSLQRPPKGSGSCYGALCVITTTRGMERNGPYQQRSIPLLGDRGREAESRNTRGGPDRSAAAFVGNINREGTESKRLI